MNWQNLLLMVCLFQMTRDLLLLLLRWSYYHHVPLPPEPQHLPKRLRPSPADFASLPGAPSQLSVTRPMPVLPVDDKATAPSAVAVPPPVPMPTPPFPGETAPPRHRAPTLADRLRQSPPEPRPKQTQTTLPRPTTRPHSRRPPGALAPLNSNRIRSDQCER